MKPDRFEMFCCLPYVVTKSILKETMDTVKLSET